MPTISVFDMNGKEIEKIELAESVFGIEPNVAVMNDVVKNILANRRQGTQSALTFAGTGYVHLVPCCENVRFNKVAYIVSVDVFKTELTQSLLGGDIALGEMALHGLVHLVRLQVAEAHLNRVVAIGFNGLLLRNDTRAGFYNRYGDDLAVCVEDLRHADLLADDCFLHSFLPPVRLLVGLCQHDPDRQVG